MTSPSITSFKQLALAKPLLTALDQVGYEAPTPIQAETIPLLLEGKDVLGQAQTGTGKTAAFALPLITRLDLKSNAVQVLVLAPTRELAIQVAEAFQQYAKLIAGFRVLPIYGGQEYRTQMRGLSRGAHVVVGTPGRVMDHMRRGTLKLDGLQALVLDEADEMLRMGFLEDVEWVLEKSPPKRQIALFSATMPKEISRIAHRHLNDPTTISIKNQTATASTIRQRFLMVKGPQKLEALTRILEAEAFDAVLVFVRTKNATLDLAQRLAARGYVTAALNGDIAQNQREKTINDLKKKRIDILVATDVAARGLDVERISHVVNFDIPYDTEAYVHRIGRTGRAGREGDAILFVAPRERRLLSAIEKATRQKITPLTLPTTESINARRVDRFKQRISDTIEQSNLNFFRGLINDHAKESGADAGSIAAALAYLLQGEQPFLLSNKPTFEESSHRSSDHRSDRRSEHRSEHRNEHRDEGKRFNKNSRRERTAHSRSAPRARDKAPRDDSGMERFRIEIGSDNDVKPGNIMGAIANEAGIDGEHIGRIDIQDDHSFVDLPQGMPKDIFNSLKRVWVSGKQLKISRTEPKVKARTRGPNADLGGPSASNPLPGKGEISKKAKAGKPKAKKRSKPKKPKSI